MAKGLAFGGMVRAKVERKEKKMYFIQSKIRAI
jgi:hypothetical protein